MIAPKVLRKMGRLVERNENSNELRTKSFKMLVEESDVSYFQSLEASSEQFLDHLNVLLKNNQDS